MGKIWDKLMEDAKPAEAKLAQEIVDLIASDCDRAVRMVELLTLHEQSWVQHEICVRSLQAAVRSDNAEIDRLDEFRLRFGWPARPE